MNLQALKDFLEEFDLTSLIPDIHQVLDVVAPTAKVLMLLGPFVLLGFGLYCLMIAPKEATYLAGYRFRWGMGSVESWRFMQRFAGVVFLVLGLGLAVFMALQTQDIDQLALMDLLNQAIMYVVMQAGVALAGCLLTNLAVILRYDRKGVRRYTWWELIKG